MRGSESLAFVGVCAALVAGHTRAHARRALQATYVAHHALRCSSWQIRHHPGDVPRQLDRAERVLDRYEA